MKRVVAALGVLIALAAGPAAAADARNGQEIAQRWCTECHVAAEERRGSDAAPSLPAIARARGADARWLRAWLTDPHPPMPNLNLSRGDIDDLVAYLGSLPR